MARHRTTTLALALLMITSVVAFTPAGAHHREDHDRGNEVAAGHNAEQSGLGDGEGDDRTLPDDLEMEGAEVLEYTDTRVRWRWSESLGLPLWTPTTGSLVKVSTSFDVPADLPLGIHGELTWAKDHTTHLGMELRNGSSTLVCTDGRANPTYESSATCRVVQDPTPEDEDWTVTVVGFMSERASVPFQLDLTISLQPERGGPAIDPTPCEHPWPCGDGSEWPTGLEGPFDLLNETQVRIPSHDGTVLHGWLWRPELPEGVDTPILVTASPYLSGASASSAIERNRVLALEEFVPNGFASLLVSVRGTGASGGCFTNEGPDERRDHAFLIEWAAGRSWSNGRVGMMGISYMGQTTLHAAFAAPEPLKATLVMAAETRYHNHHTPQGAPSTNGLWYEVARRGIAGPTGLTGDYAQLISSAQVAEGRVCPETIDNMLITPRGQLTDDRAEWWEQRENYVHFPNITAATWVTQGFADLWNPWGQDVAWPLMGDTPSRFDLGPWEHEPPTRATFDAERIAWFDYWLKGIGAVPDGLGTVDYQDSMAVQRRSASWPPAEALHEALFLADGSLAIGPREASSTYTSEPIGPRGPAGALCPDAAEATSAVAFLSDPLEEGALLAGNPFVYLNLQADESGGLVGVWLLETDAVGSCDNARVLTNGAADLRFYNGNYVGHDFPVDRTTPVRIDMEMIAEQIDAGSRLAVVVAHPGPWELPADDREGRLQPGVFPSSGRFSGTSMPDVIVQGGSDGHASHVVLPFVEGGLGGSPATIEHPGRPFVPEV